MRGYDNSQNKETEEPTNPVADVQAPVSPPLVAALLLAAVPHLRTLDLPRPTVEQIIEATNAGRSRAYELRDELLALLPSLQRPVGRPATPHIAPARTEAYELRGVVTAYVMAHAGCVHGSVERRRYTDPFRHFILDLRDKHSDMDVAQFVDACMVPFGTLKAWLDAGVDAGVDAPTPIDAPQPEGDDSETGTSLLSAHAQVVLSCWENWHGTFRDFCKHVRQEQRVPLGSSLISQILFVHGKRQPQRRAGRSPDERAMRDAFKTFFGGAQWVGDGSPIAVTIGEQRFVFNLELMVDAYSGGFIGMSVRDQEDSAAVTEAFNDGAATTGEVPLAVLLDNRPSNHTPEVDAALGDLTMRMRATPFRPQNKAHVEGGFGLFQQTIPALVLAASQPRELARQMLILIAQTWARTLNHRPRADRNDRSRFDLHKDPVNAKQLDETRAALKAKCDKQERARLTALLRLDPTVRATLDDAFRRLELLDPENHFRVAIARYPLDIILEGIAIFAAKRHVGTLPPGVDARYLLGIVHNLGNEREGIAIAEELLRVRLEAKDRMLATLVAARDAAHAETPDLLQRLIRFADRALASDRRIDRLFWLNAVATDIKASGAADHRALVDHLARRIHATHRVPYRERLEAVRIVVENITPLS